MQVAKWGVFTSRLRGALFWYGWRTGSRPYEAPPGPRHHSHTPQTLSTLGLATAILYARNTMAARLRREAVIAVERLTFALSDPDDSRPGSLVPEILTALEGVQDAVRLLVQHLGDREKGPGQPPKWIRDQSTLRLVEMRPGSLIVDLVVEAPPDGQAYLDDFGNRAIVALPPRDDRGFHSAEFDTLHLTASKLSDGVGLWFGDRENPHRTEVQRRPAVVRTTTDVTEALLQGWLYESIGTGAQRSYTTTQANTCN